MGTDGKHVPFKAMSHREIIVDRWISQLLRTGSKCNATMKAELTPPGSK
jgi:hypothetical protein